MNKLDLFLLPIYLQDRQEEPGLPGLIAAAAPRRAERSRREDFLVINMHLSGSRVPSPIIQESIVSQMVEPYFRTRGTVTNGLRAVAEQLNQFLLDQNQRSTREDAQTQAHLNLAVLRRDVLYLAHAGSTHSFIMTAQEFLDLHEQIGITQSLGTFKQAELSFHQVGVKPGDVYIPCVEPPSTWTEESLAGLQQTTLESLRRKLLDLSGSYLQAGVVKFQRGEGRIVRLKPRMRYVPQPGGEFPVTQQVQDAGQPIPVEAPDTAEPLTQPPLLETQPSPDKQEPPTQLESQPQEQPPQQQQPLTQPQMSGEQPPQQEQPPEKQQPLTQQQAPGDIKQPDQQPKPETFTYGRSGLPTLEELLGTPAPTQAPIQPIETPAETQAAVEPQSERPPEPAPEAEPVPELRPTEPAHAPDESVDVLPEELIPAVESISIQPEIAEPDAEPQALQPPAEEFTDQDEGGFHEPFSTDIIQLADDADPEESEPRLEPTETPQEQTETAPSPQTEPDIYEEPDIQPFVTDSSMAKPGSRDLLENFSAKAVDGFSSLKRSFINAIQKLLTSDRLKRLFKERQLDRMTGNLSVTTMIFIAIAVPLAVVGIATAVYFNSGVSEQHELYLYQAQQFTLQALNSGEDQDAARDAWTQAMYWLDQAEEYGRTDASRELRIQIIDALDSMEGIARLPLVSSMNNDLPSSVQVGKIIATESDAYLLDYSNGEVLRIFSTDTGYKLDTQFECGPGPSGSIIISPLIDVVELPINNRFNARVMGIDRNGNLSYCMPGDTPLTQPLALPDVGWGKISAMALDKGNLYVLDINNNAVWVYEGYNLTFTENPRLFFDLDIPILGDVVDMEVNGDDLFLMHNDGRMSRCTFRVYDFADTKCEDPTVYRDQRGDSDLELETFPDSLFTQMITTEPPDPSIYILDPRSTGIYHFSLMLNLQQILLPLPDKDYPIPTQAVSAFTINPNRMIFMAFGNKIYQAPLP